MSAAPELTRSIEGYLRTKHIPEIFATGCFVEIRCDRLDPTTVRTTYGAATRADLDRYLNRHATHFRADFAAHFPSGATVSREVWEQLQAWPAGPDATSGTLPTSLQPLVALLRLNTDLVLNCLDGLTPDAATARPGGGNSIAFLTAHLTDARHYLAGYLDRPLDYPLPAYLRQAKSIDDLETLPPLPELRDAWERVATHLDRVWPSLTAAELTTPSPQRFPLEDLSRLGGLTFLVQHDSYHLGQIALLRRQLGYPAMAYRRRP